MSPRAAPQAQTGFFLVEVAIAVIVFGILMAGAIAVLRLQTERAQRGETQSALDEAKQALLSYAASNGRLPCPASPTNTAPSSFGESEALVSGSCEHVRGILPWKTLNIRGMDGWGQYLSYAVTTPLTNVLADSGNRITGFTGETAGTLNLQISSTQSLTPAFVVWSHGKNGSYGINADLFTLPGSNNTDEKANDPKSISSVDLVAHAEEYDANDSTKSFDDIATWVSTYVLTGAVRGGGFCVPPNASATSCTLPPPTSSSG
ncbi:type II secretion system protein [Uliginosibacterium gangwonense]|uniref:type II secretion system protein n=1 Tax=Uliginosibacterium gangwonense TaxID=392736 RepID=UPI0003737F5D|nr:type II secretion system protein [Uliginosibacterium gangwonense]